MLQLIKQDLTKFMPNGLRQPDVLIDKDGEERYIWFMELATTMLVAVPVLSYLGTRFDVETGRTNLTDPHVSYIVYVHHTGTIEPAWFISETADIPDLAHYVTRLDAGDDPSDMV